MNYQIVCTIEDAIKEEREACAKIADALNIPVPYTGPSYHSSCGRSEAAEEIAKLIRSRSAGMAEMFVRNTRTNNMNDFRPTYNHSREDSALTPCAQCKQHQEFLKEVEELKQASWQALGALIGAYAADDSVQGEARIRLAKCFGINSTLKRETK